MSENRKISGFYLNPNQHSFVENFLSYNSVPNHLLHAPVGSGKTVVASAIISEMIKTGAKRILVLVPALVLVDQYKRALSEIAQDINIISLNRKLVREVESLKQSDSFWARTISIASLQQVVSEEIKESILSVHWDLIIIDEIEHVTPNGRQAGFIKNLIENQCAKRFLILSNQTPVALSRSSVKRFLSNRIFESFDVTNWSRKSIYSGQDLREVKFTTIHYERTKEEIDFIKKYANLSKWLLNKKLQNKIRSRLVSSSLFAAEESLRNLRNRLVHEDLRNILDAKDIGNDFIKDEELLGDTNKSQVDRKFGQKDIPLLMNDLSVALEYFDMIQTDSKFNMLSQVVNDIRGKKQRTWIYTSYQSTISFLYSSLSEQVENVFQIHGQIPSRITIETIQRFRESDGFLISSTNQLMGSIDLALDNLVLYDTPDSESLIYNIFTRISGSSQEKNHEPVNIFVLDDTSTAIKSERIRLEKMQKFLQKLVQEEI